MLGRELCNTAMPELVCLHSVGITPYSLGKHLNLDSCARSELMCQMNGGGAMGRARLAILHD